MADTLNLDESVFLIDVTKKISKVLQLQSKILDNAKLDTEFSPGTPTINYNKLEKFENFSRQLFSDISLLSDQLHKVAKYISPSYTRLNSFHTNEHTQFKDFDSFTYTYPLELQTSSQLYRLQNDFLNGK